MTAESTFEIEILRDAIAANESDPNHDPALLARQRELLARAEERAAKGITRPSLEVPNEPGFKNRPAAGARAANQFGTFKVHPASPAQMRFIERLLGERDLASLTRGPAPVDLDALRADLVAKRVNKRTASDLIERLLVCPELPGTTTLAVLATEKQMEFLRRLMEERNVPVSQIADVERATGHALTRAEASTWIDNLVATPKNAPVEVLEPEAAMYRHPETGEILKVYRAVHGSNKMCAKRLVVEDAGGTWSTDTPGTTEPASVRFEYLGLAVRFLRGHVRMTLEQAREFGHIYGVCCSCGATLTDEESIEAGIGPVCARKFAKGA